MHIVTYYLESNQYSTTTDRLKKQVQSIKENYTNTEKNILNNSIAQLHDTIINFYLAFISYQNLENITKNDIYVFESFFWATYCKKNKLPFEIPKNNFLVVPSCTGSGTSIGHWFLVIYSKAEDKAWILDSLFDCMTSRVEKLIKFVFLSFCTFHN